MEEKKISSNQVQVPSTSTSVYDAIFGRRMTKEFTDEPVSNDVLNRLFDAAIWAPNHRLTDPTRFFVIEKSSPMREKVAQLAWQTAYDAVANPNPDQKQRSADAAKTRVLDAPAMVYVYSVPGNDDETTQENYATSCCSVQNMALGAVAEGLTLDWSTGGISKIPDLETTLGADPDWTMVGVVFLGVAKTVPPGSRRLPPSEVVSWLS